MTGVIRDTSEVEEQGDQTAEDQRAQGDFEQVAAQHLPSVPQDKEPEKKTPGEPGVKSSVLIMVSRYAHKDFLLTTYAAGVAFAAGAAFLACFTCFLAAWAF